MKIKKLLAFFSIIITICPAILSLEADLNNQVFIQIKENLIKAVENSDYQKVEDELYHFSQLPNKLGINTLDANEIIKFNKDALPVYRNNLLYEPLDGKPKNASAMEIALAKKNLTILYVLLQEDNKATKEQFLDYLNQHLKPTINLTKDEKYVAQKRALVQAINEHNTIPSVQKIIERFEDTIKGNFITKSGPDPDFIITGYFYNYLWPEYKIDLIKQVPDSPLMTALNKQDLMVLYLLFIEFGNGYEDYINFINNHPIEPEHDPLYMAIKNNLIVDVKANNFLRVTSLLSAYYRKLYYKYINPSLMNSGKDEIELNYKMNIKPGYSIDLLKTVIPLALSSKNYRILYKILEQLIYIKRPIEFITLIHESPSLISGLLKITEQAIYDYIDYIIIKSIYLVLAETKKKINMSCIDLLTLLKNFGIDQQRLDNNIVKASAYYFSDLNNSLIALLKNKKLISHFNEEDYKQYKLLKEINKLGPFNLESIKRLLPELTSINLKDIKGNSLLINFCNHNLIDLIDDLIEFIKFLITDKHANLNQPGAEGITPLMYIAKSTFVDKSKQTDLIKFFISHGAHIQSKDMFGNTALDYAQETKGEKNATAIQALSTQTPVKLVPLNKQLISLNSLSTTIISLANKR